MKMQTQHTPGPWHVGTGKAESIIYYKEGWAVANAIVFHSEISLEEIHANARLIAAAPEMLEALKHILPYTQCGDKLVIEAAIAKAEGRA